MIFFDAGSNSINNMESATLNSIEVATYIKSIFQRAYPGKDFWTDKDQSDSYEVLCDQGYVASFTSNVSGQYWFILIADNGRSVRVDLVDEENIMKQALEAHKIVNSKQYYGKPSESR